jgi:DNA polymerase-4/protein ImuB
MAITCLRIPHLALRIALLDQPELDGLPLLLSNPESGRAVVLDATPEATDKGVRVGMTLREATSFVPDAVVVVPNPAMESRVSIEILQKLEGLSPLVEQDTREQGCWYIDLIGLDRHFPSPTEAARSMLQCVPAILRPRAGVSTSHFTARVAAGVARSTDVRTIPIGGEKAFLAQTPVTWLPFPPEMTNQMVRLGLRTMGDLAALPPARLAARFGPKGRLAWELANGTDKRLIQARPREESVVEELEMPTPAVSRDMLFLGIRQLVTRAFNRRVLTGKHVRQVTLRAFLENKRSWEKPLVMKEPCGQQALMRTLEMRLQALELPGPVEAIALQLSGIVNTIAHQGMLPLFQPRHTKPVTEAVDQLRHRYGSNPVYRVVEVEPWSRIPERRHALITYEP